MERKVALVTGSSKGIGRGIAICLARAGYDVGINYNSDLEGAEFTAGKVRELGGKAIVLKGNIKNLYEIQTLFEGFFKEFDHIDLMVNNAGITRGMPFLETTPELWEEVINTDFRGTYFCGQAAARKMVEKGTRGVIVNITSNHVTGCFSPFSVYSAAKAALDRLTRSMALELAEYGIRVVSIAPGCTDLEWFVGDIRENYVNRVAPRIPLKRFASTEEIGEAVVFLASEKAGFITGTSLTIDGGALLPVATM